MATVAQSTSSVAQPPPVLMRRFTVEEYHRMIEAGVFADDERFELLEGWIVAKTTCNPPHDVAIELLTEALRGALPAGWRVRVQSAITLTDSEPEPDLAVVRGAVRDHVQRHPDAAEIAVVIEVADSSLAQDRDLKGRVYARAGIPAYWIVNVAAHRVEVYTNPTGPAPLPSYRDRRDHNLGDPVPLVIEGQQIAWIDPRDVLP